MARLLSYHDPNFPVVAGISVGMALGIKGETTNSTKWNKGCRVDLLLFKHCIFIKTIISLDSNIIFALQYFSFQLPHSSFFFVCGGGVIPYIALCTYKKYNGLLKILKQEDGLYLLVTRILDSIFLSKC